MPAPALTPLEQLHDDIDLLDAAGWPMERVRAELSHAQIEEMIDAYLARSDDAVAGALSSLIDEALFMTTSGRTETVSWPRRAGAPARL